MTGTSVLLYVPGIQASEENSAQRIAELIARSESIDRPGEYSVRNVGNSKDATILAPNLEPVLRVVEVSYDSQLNWSEAAKPETTIKALVRSVRFTVLASIRLLAAWRRPAKSTRAKIQLGLGLLAVLVLFATVVIVALALVAAIRPSALPGWMASESAVPRLAWAAGGLTAGGLFWWARPRLLEAGKLVRTIMRYAEKGATAPPSQLRLLSKSLRRAPIDLPGVGVVVDQPVHPLGRAGIELPRWQRPAGVSRRERRAIYDRRCWPVRQRCHQQ